MTGDAPAAMIAKDGHSLWLNSAALALADGDLEVEGGVVERDARGEPTGVLREESAWRFQARYLRASADEYVDAMRRGLRLAAARGVTAVHDKDGGLGALGLWQRLEAERRAVAARLAVGAARPARPSCARSGFARASAAGCCGVGYLKVFMDGTLGSQTAWLLDGSGVQITSGEQLAEIVREAAGAGLPVAVHAIGDRANRDALDAFEATRDAWRRSGCASGSSTRSCSRRRICRASRSSASRRRCSSRTRRPTAISPTGSGRARPTARTRTARCGTRARSSRTARTRRSRSSTRSPASAPACGGRSTSARRGIPSRR